MIQPYKVISALHSHRSPQAPEALRSSHKYLAFCRSRFWSPSCWFDIRGYFSYALGIILYKAACLINLVPLKWIIQHDWLIIWRLANPRDWLITLDSELQNCFDPAKSECSFQGSFCTHFFNKDNTISIKLKLYTYTSLQRLKPMDCFAHSALLMQINYKRLSV